MPTVRAFGGRAGAALLIAGLLALSGCGYALEGTRRTGSLKDARSISIPAFINESGEPGLDITITNAVRSGFLTDGRLRVIESSAADVVLVATIREYRLEPIGFSGTDQVQRYRVFIRTFILVRDTVRGLVVLNQEIESDSEFDITTSIAGSDQRRVLANATVASLFSNELISLVLEGF